MGRKHVLKANPALAEPHAEGATVYFMQPLVHSRFGGIAYAHPRYWTFHFEIAKANAGTLTACHELVLAMEPGTSARRSITDEPFLLNVYDVGSAMVSNAVRAVQHLAEEIERLHNAELSAHTVAGRIGEAAALYSDKACHASVDYAALGELTSIRDAIEHPRDANISALDPNGWDRAPLAWMLSDRSVECWARFDRWFSQVSADWEQYRPTLDRPATITVSRGLESQLQVKKPSRKRH